MLAKIVLLLLCKSLLVESDSTSDFFVLTVFKHSFTDWKACWSKSHPTKCVEERTLENLENINDGLREELGLESTALIRTGKFIDEDNDPETESIISENQRLLKKIKNATAGPRQLMEEIGDLISFLTFRFLKPFTNIKREDSDEDDSEDEDEEDDEEEQGNDDSRRRAVQERGHKKKELKKKNKKLKLILLLMLLKNKMKMFLSKLQFIVQVKFLGVATINMLANLIRLWLEIRKKHKPQKVIYYENAHHQHHYENEHIHDHEEIHFTPPTHYTQHPHHQHHPHEEDDHSSGLWPWSRSYGDTGANIQQNQNSNPYQFRPGSYKLSYYNQR